MVNTFLPYRDFEKTAQTLDYKRLGKQRVEARQIINIIEFPDRYHGWKSHPAVLMWKPYLPYLKRYFNIMVIEWIKRGYKNTMQLFESKELKTSKKPPWWLGYRPFHLAYQASLLRKNFEYYKKYFQVPKEYMKYTYIWPTNLSPIVINGIKSKKRYQIADLTQKINPKLLNIKK